MNGGDFGSGNTASPLCNLAEIWPYPINFVGAGGNAALYGLGELAGNNDNNNSNNNAYTNGCDRVSVDDPMDMDRGGSNFQSKKRREEDDSSRGVSTSSPSNCNAMQNDDSGKRPKILGTENENSKLKSCGSSGKRLDNSAKPSEPLKQDYIHVRARRGQATDSHSLAERARREKISERMKILQDLVPGCNKVIGKALVLDEIINYIQALQRQVEFLSMKLEAVTSRSNLNPEGFPSKDSGQQTFDLATASFVSQPSREFSKASSPEWLHMQIGGSFQRTT